MTTNGFMQKRKTTTTKLKNPLFLLLDFPASGSSSYCTETKVFLE